jgi:hypothetical protein
MPIDHSKPWSTPPPPPRQPRPGERLFEFTRSRDGTAMWCELRFHGESGWEVQLFDPGGFLYGRGAFTMRAAALQWAEDTRGAIERKR